ncbi:MFS transporter [Marinactinospora rubrisoli]|uniref:Lysosomal dipeptide transporter MFSD1 n=1 Tax=Marinactinospora rubrisoli TaxID=2715399 RepID=A0ABW2KAL5_9ACTN
MRLPAGRRSANGAQRRTPARRRTAGTAASRAAAEPAEAGAPAAPVTHRPAAEPPGGARAWLVWGTAVAVYFAAMFHRNGMSAAALMAQERFDTGATLLSMLPVLQLAVYVACQIPGGVLADRLGPRGSLLIGLAAMVGGTALFAVAPTIQAAIAGRILIGFGDALVFLNVIRLGALWFPRREYAVVSALTGLVGGLGQVASVAPLSALLRNLGWTPAFLAASGVTSALLVLVLILVRDRPAGFPAPGRAERISVRASLAEALRARGPRVGMAHHAAAMTSYTMLAVLWGYPLLEQGLGLDPGTAGALFTGAALAPMALVPFLARLTGARPGLRRPLALTLTWTVSLGWLAVVAWPGGLPPLWATGTVIVLSAAGSVIAPSLSFDYARDGMPAQRTGVAAALVNMCGFATVVVATIAAGALLDAQDGPTGGEAFQVAFTPMAAMLLAATAVLTALLWRYPRAGTGRP